MEMEAEPTAEEVARRARLPTDVVPHHYALRLAPDLNAFIFHGSVDVTIEIVRPVQTVYVNALELEVASAVVELTAADGSVEGTETSAALVHDVAGKPVLAIRFARVLRPGPAVLRMVFRGTLNDKLAGFYRSKYTVNGEVRYHATTQFEATDARRAFPCWDEPALKATFDVTLVVPADRVAISNMPIADSEPLQDGSGGRVVRFGRTPIMSTYLLAFIVGEFDSIAAESSTGVEVRVYTALGKTALGQFALDVAKQALAYYAKLFDIPYPLPKMDLIAIPDFAAGAMENWGCITYREFSLLIDEHQSTQDRRTRVARTVCHEIAHQWFGNLVTMEWWTHLWLNEGFARFLEFFAVNDIFPSWNVWSMFVAGIHDLALRADSLSSSHAIEVPVTSPDEINEIFDTISYAKGACVIRMLSEYLGASTLFDGLRIYLKRHQYKNATTEDLWRAFEEASGKQVAPLMQLWTRQVGYPVLVLPETEDGVVTQVRFLASGDSGDGRWMLPVSAIGASDAAVVDLGLLDTDQDHRKLADWVRINNPVMTIKLNAGQVGFYRVLYNSATWRKLMYNLHLLPQLDRLGVLTDTLALSKAGLVTVARVMEVLSALRSERSLSIWAEIAQHLKGYVRLFADLEWAPLLNRFVTSVFMMLRKWALALSPAHAQGHQPYLLTLHTIITDVLVQVGEPSVLAEVNAAFAAHVQLMLRPHEERDPAATILSPDQRHSAYVAAITVDGEKAYDELLALYRQTDLSEEQRNVLRAIGSASTRDLLWRAMEFALSDEVRPQDAATTLVSVAINPRGRKLAWEFFVTNFDRIMAIFNTGGQAFLLSGLVDEIGSTGTSREDLAEITAFFAAHSMPAAERAIHNAQEKVRIHYTRIEREGPQLLLWLQNWEQQRLAAEAAMAALQEAKLAARAAAQAATEAAIAAQAAAAQAEVAAQAVEAAAALAVVVDDPTPSGPAAPGDAEPADMEIADAPSADMRAPTE